MYQNSVKIPMGDWAEKRLKKLSETDMKRDESKVKRWIWKENSKLGRQKHGLS